MRDLAAGTRVFTYGHVVDPGGVLVGVLTKRDLLLHEQRDRLETFMLRAPFSLRAQTSLTEAMRLTVNKHFPSYPVCDTTAR